MWELNPSRFSERVNVGDVMNLVFALFRAYVSLMVIFCVLLIILFPDVFRKQFPRIFQNSVMYTGL